MIVEILKLEVLGRVSCWRSSRDDGKGAGPGPAQPPNFGRKRFSVMISRFLALLLDYRPKDQYVDWNTYLHTT